MVLNWNILERITGSKIKNNLNPNPKMKICPYLNLGAKWRVRISHNYEWNILVHSTFWNLSHFLFFRQDNEKLSFMDYIDRKNPNIK
jgi:hypothetical protein